MLSAMEFSLTTLNLYGPNDWKNRKPKIIKYLRGLQSDVVVLQEVVSSKKISRDCNTAQIINQALGYQTEASTVKRPIDDRVYGHFDEGLAILSKHPLIREPVIVDPIQAPGDPHTRFMQMAGLAIGSWAVWLRHLHASLLKPGPDFATAHIRQAFAYQAKHGENDILVGDFQRDDVGNAIPEWANQYVASTDGRSDITQPDAIGDEGVLEDRCPDQAWAPRSHYQFTGGVALSPRGLSDHLGATFTLQTIGHLRLAIGIKL